MADPPFARRLFDLGAEPQASTPAELAAFMRKDPRALGAADQGAQVGGQRDPKIISRASC